MKLDFIIIGAHKSGTTWVHKCLETHPQVCMPVNPAGFSSNQKVEPDFFNDTQMPWRSDLEGISNYKKGLEWYSRFFSQCSNDSVIGESSPIYLHSPEVPERIYQHFPNVKLIAVLRNPINRLLSLYNYTKLNDVGKNRIEKSFSDFIKSEKVLDLNMYYKHIQHYLKFFPKEQMQVLIYEDIEKNEKNFMKNIYEYLGIDTTFISSYVEAKVNSVESRIIEEQKRSKRNKYGRVIGKLLSFVDRFRTGTMKKELEKISPEDRAYLMTKYAEDIYKLSEFLGRDLSFWK